MANPFQSLLTTDTLRGRREAQIEEDNKGESPFVRGAARSGFQGAEALRKMGFGVTLEDQKAQANQEAMTGASKKYETYMKQGASPDQAQEMVLTDAVSTFSTIGNFEAANALMEPLQAIRKQRAERAKLQAQEYQATAEGNKTVAETGLLAGEAASEDRLRLAQGNNQNTAATENIARANLANRTDPNIRAAGKGGKVGKDGMTAEDFAVYELKQRDALRNKGLAAADSFELFATIKELVMSNPTGALWPGALASQVQGLAEGARRAIMVDDRWKDKEGRFTVNIDELREGGTAVSRLEKLNVTDARLQSATLDVAFALARLRDPGGRLSNQDVDKAIEIVSGKGGTRARIRVLEDVADRASQSLERELKDSPYAEMQGVAPAFEAARDKYGRYKAVKAPAAGAQPDGSIRTKAGGVLRRSN